MSTLGDLVNSIHSALHSYTGIQEQQTWLTAGIDADDTALTVASLDAAQRGIAEIDDELVYVASTDDANGVELAPFGRGYRGTTAATHAINSAVTFAPAWPKAEIRKAITQCLDGLFPQLYQIKTTDISYLPNPVGYDLPADC
jgi:hypothetical protein